MEAQRFQRRAFKWELMYIYNEKALFPPPPPVQPSIETPNLQSFNGADKHDKPNEGQAVLLKPLILESSLNMAADDLSDIPKTRVQITPAFKNKEVINFYEDVSEDISMLKEILTDRPDETTMLNQTEKPLTKSP